MATGNDTFPVLRLADSSFQQTGQSDSVLLIHLSLSRLSYAIYQSISNTVFAYCHHTLTGDDRFGEALQILRTDAWANATFANVQLAIRPDDFALVPKDLFDPREIATYLNFHSFKDIGGSQLFDRMDGIGVVGAYHISHHVLDGLSRQYPNIKVWATPSPFITLGIREYKTAKSDNLLVLFEDDLMHLTALNQGKLVYYNSFEIAAKEDVSYYTLAVCEQLHLSPEKVLVIAWGNGDAHAERFDTLKYYYRNVQHGARPMALKFSDSLSALPDFSEYSLFAVALCE